MLRLLLQRRFFNRYVHPKSKAAVLNALRQSGFTKEDLRDLDWSFSNNLWNAGSLGASFADEFRTEMTSLPAAAAAAGMARQAAGSRALSLVRGGGGGAGDDMEEEETSRTMTTTTSRTIRTTRTTRRHRRRKKRKQKVRGEREATHVSVVIKAIYFFVVVLPITFSPSLSVSSSSQPCI